VYKTFLKVSIKKNTSWVLDIFLQGEKIKNLTKFKNTKTIGGIVLNLKRIYYTHEIMYKLEMVE